MKATAKPWILMLFLLPLGACQGTVASPLLAYSFEHPLLNTQWQGAYGPRREAPRAPAPAARASKAAQPAKAQAARAEEPPARKQAAAAQRAKPAEATQATAPREAGPAAIPAAAKAPEGPGFLPAARRVLGIRDFNTDSWLRHLLFVTGVDPGEGQGSLATRLAQLHRPNPRAQPAPGDLVFFKLNDGSYLVGVAETLAQDGHLAFLAPHRGEVRRLTAHLGRPGVIRDEGSRQELNTVLDRNLTAGRAFQGPVGLIRSSRGAGGALAARD